MSEEILELEEKVLERIREDMFKANSIDSINKLYRQGRVWNRWHSIGLGRPFKEDPQYVEINNFLKKYRDEAKALVRLNGGMN